MPKRKHISKSTRLKVYEKYNGHCAYCGCELALKEMQVDHIQSVYWYDGANDIENYNPACRMCNFYKSTMSVEDFREQLGKILSRLEKVFIFRLAKKYDLIREIKEPVIFYFEKENLKKVVDFEPKKPIKSDVQEIKHGKWVSTGNALGYTEYHCSECYNYLFLDSKDDELYNYCPHCGAKMDKE
ncbi:HNH endonuclease [Ruminococcus sp.]|uniref:HNH endonuclease n=1 Tax=Ruminococcus sp. TaxID=41978 RepID=UPI003520AE06